MSMKATIQKTGAILDVFILTKWQTPILAFSTLDDCFGMDRVREFCQVRGLRVIDPSKREARRG